MRVVDSWTGATADALRQAFRMTIEDFAEQLGLSPRTVAYWRERPDMVQRPFGQRILDTALEQAPDAIKARFALLASQHLGSFPADDGGAPGALSSVTPRNIDVSTGDAKSVLEWVESTNVNDGFLAYFDRTIEEIAKEHTYRPPVVLLAKVQQLHGMIQTLLRSGKQRYRQTRELLRLEADLLAHMCQLLGDIHHDDAALAYAAASVGLADEAGSSSAAAFSAQSQIARWRGQYIVAADLAARGLASDPSPDLRTLLAYQEADAAASGQMASRAYAALEKAESADDNTTFYSVWSCPPARRALFRMAVPLNLGDPHEALRIAVVAEPIWQQERTQAFGSWAHFRISVAKAHVMVGSVDSAVKQVAPVLDLPGEYRISTLAGHFSTLDGLLADQRFTKSAEVASLRDLLRDFGNNSSAAESVRKENG
jgi:hypothetical protein